MMIYHLVHLLNQYYMKLSIITVVRNAEKTIRYTIESVVNQIFTDYEYIIIDGCSNDGTKNIIESFSGKISKYVSEPDKGIYDAMNKGLRIAEGDWVYFMGADDVIFSTDIFHKLFKNNLDDVDVLYGNVLFKNKKILFDGEFNAEKLCSRSPCHQAVLYRRKLFDIYGEFEIKYTTAADYVLHIKTFCGGARWKYVNEIFAIYNELGASFLWKDKQYLNNNFEIRLMGFKGHVGKKSLARIFLSSYWRFFLSHPIRKSLKYLNILFSYINIWTVVSVIIDKCFKKQ